MQFYGRMPMGFSGAVSLISCAQWSWADVYGCNRFYLWSFQHSRFSCLTCGKKRKGEKKKREKKGRREKGDRKEKQGRNIERSEAREEGILTKVKTKE